MTRLDRRDFLGVATGVGGAAIFASALQGHEAFAAAAEIDAAANPYSLTDINNLPRVKQQLVPPPMLPAYEQVATDGPKVVEVTLTIDERKMKIDDEDTEVWALTFNGSVPGPTIVVHEGDFVELTLVNPASSMMEHNIDFHAATGALGGGALTKVQPGEDVVLRWKAVKPGVFVYHCAPEGIMIPYHVVHGMNGSRPLPRRSGRRESRPDAFAA